VNRRLRSDADALRLAGAAAPVDTADVPGLLLLSPPPPLLAAEPHWHCHLPHLVFLEAVDAGRLPTTAEAEAFEAGLLRPWTVLGLLAPINRMWVFPPERRLPLLRAAAACWATLDGEGERYSVGSTAGQRLWSLGTNLKYILSNLGVSNETLAAPLPAGGLGELLALIPSATRD
jgi:hypothetical protein